MTATLMQLAGKGPIDAGIYGNPQFSIWVPTYRRITPFAVETIEISIDGLTTGGRNTTRLDRNGDLASRMAFRCRIPDVMGACLAVGTQVGWVHNLGNALIKQVDIRIGSSTIDTQYGVWLNVWQQLTYSESKVRGADQLLGNVPEMTAMRGKCTTAPQEVVIDGYDLYVPMNFWFCKTTGCALPLIALQYHEVQISVEIENICKLMLWSGECPPNFNQFLLQNAGWDVDYVYLDQEERRRFAQVAHEYLIEVLQYFEGTIVGSPLTYKNINRYQLGFNLPTKEIIWTQKLGVWNGEQLSANYNNNYSRFLTYTHEYGTFAWERAINRAAENLARGMLWLTNPINCGIAPTNFIEINPGSYGSGAGIVLAPGESQPLRYNLGGDRFVTLNLTHEAPCNMECAEDLDLSCLCPMYLLKCNLFTSKTVPSGCCYDLGNFIKNAIIEVAVDNSCCDHKNIRVTGVVVTAQNLTLRDLSIPVNYWCDNRFTTNQVCGFNPWDITVIMPTNYGLRMDGYGNPSYEAVIQFNGQDRFTVQKGAFFNFYVPFNVHTRVPAYGINVYSFALYPEEYQPSGTANLSRMDTTYLNVTYSDILRINKQVPILDYITGTIVYVFALSYNVLRIMSGMGGLAYSN